MTHAVGTAGNRGLPGRGPISWEEMGERTPEGRGSSLWTPFSGGVVWGRLYLLRDTWPAALPAKGPWRPAHRLGGLGTWTGTLWEKAESNHSGSRFFLPSMNHLSRPPELVGGP